MEQRRLRLGDILDDYCPRERRVTNHAVVAMIEEDVKQTRCTTCDTEHAYKGGKVPRRRKAGGTGTLYKEVLAGLSDADAPPQPVSTMLDHNHDESSFPSENPPTVPEPAEEPEAPLAAEPEPRAADEGPVHRPLIRATLPRPEGIKTERPLPDFTIRQNAGRGNGHFRAKAGGRHPSGGGRPGGQRFGRGSQGRGGQGRPGAFGRGPDGGRHAGPKKRSR